MHTVHAHILIELLYFASMLPVKLEFTYEMITIRLEKHLYINAAIMGPGV